MTDEQEPDLGDLLDLAADDEYGTPNVPSPPCFDDLVSNGLDFLERAIAEVKKSPKYSVMHFSTGIELLLKARLLREHWALILVKPGERTMEQFRKGDFESVNLKQCVERLENVCGESLKEEWASFEQLASDRNKVVHFFHNMSSSESAPSLVQGIVIKQLRAGAFLMRLLRHRWEKEFSAHEDAIAALETSLRGHKQYLKAKLALVTPELEEFKKSGGEIWDCFFCRMASAMVTDWGEPLKTTRCLVCERYRSYVIAKCPQCGEGEIEFDVGEGTCPECDESFDLGYLLEEYGGGGAVAHCPECSYGKETVVEHGSGYLCLTCGNEFAEVGECEFCNESVAGDLEGSYLSGCMFCDGYIGWHKDD